MTDQRHLTDSDLAGFLDGDLAPAERTRAEAHLEACDACRAELIAVGRLVQDAPVADPVSQEAAHAVHPRWRIPAGIAGLAAAAIIAALLVWPAGMPAPDQPVLERSASEGFVRLETHHPPAGEAIPREDVRFAWADHGSASYRITLTAEDGSLVWSRTLEDTVAVPPPDLELPPGGTFFWYVDAIDIGVVARTGAHTFSVSP